MDDCGGTKCVTCGSHSLTMLVSCWKLSSPSPARPHRATLDNCRQLVDETVSDMFLQYLSPGQDGDHRVGSDPAAVPLEVVLQSGDQGGGSPGEQVTHLR